MSTIEHDLLYLQENAFEFALEINPHAGCHESIADYLSGLDGRRPIDKDDWVSPDQFAQAFRTGHFLEARVYPNGSVTFFVLYGTDISTVVSELAEVCRKEQLRFRATGREPKHGSPAFDHRLPPTE